MNFTSLGILSASVVVGVAGAGATYQLTSVDAEPEQVSASVPATVAAAAKPRTGWAPCKPPAVLEGSECVIDVVRTVTLPGEPAAVSPATQPAPAPAAAAAAAAPTAVPGAGGPGTQGGHGADSAPTGETDDDCEVREGRDEDRDDCDDRGDHHDDDSTEDAAEDAADAAEDAADDAADAAEDAADDKD